MNSEAAAERKLWNYLNEFRSEGIGQDLVREIVSPEMQSRAATAFESQVNQILVRKPQTSPESVVFAGTYEAILDVPTENIERFYTRLKEHENFKSWGHAQFVSWHIKHLNSFPEVVRDKFIFIINPYVTFLETWQPARQNKSARIEDTLTEDIIRDLKEELIRLKVFDAAGKANPFIRSGKSKVFFGGLMHEVLTMLSSHYDNTPYAQIQRRVSALWGIDEANNKYNQSKDLKATKNYLAPFERFLKTLSKSA